MDMEQRRPNFDDDNSLEFYNNDDPGILCECICVFAH